MMRVYFLECADQFRIVFGQLQAADGEPHEFFPPAQLRASSLTLLGARPELIRIYAVINYIDAMRRHDLFPHVTLANSFRNRARASARKVRDAIKPLAKTSGRALWVAMRLA